MQTASTVIEHHLKKLIEEEIERLRDNLEAGPYEDHGQFKYVQGNIAALRQVLKEFLPLANEQAEKSGR